MHQIHNNKNDYAWQIRGKGGTRHVLSNTGRRRLNIIGALNPVTLIPTIFLTEANCDKELVQIFFGEIRKEYPDREKAVHLFLDNAGYNRSYEVKSKAEELNIKLHYLPPYSPNLNLIERLWKYCKKNLVKNRYYPSFDDFFQANLDFFGGIEDHIRGLQSLLTLNFQII